jgi:hypothetical protein
VFFEQRPVFFGQPFIDYIHIDGEATGAAEAQNTTCADWARCSGDLLPPSPPAEKATARQDQAGKKVHPPAIEGSIASLRLADVARK